MLSDLQRQRLAAPIDKRRVLHKDNQSHLPAFDVTAHLTRIFGFEGWDKEIISLDLVSAGRGHPTKADKKNWYVTYRCLMRLTIRDPDGNVVKVIEEGATGSSQNLPEEGDAHDFAMKNAISYALKRCAKDLGDQFGLSLYNKGSTQQLIFGSAAYAQADEGEIPEPQSMGNDERDTPVDTEVDKPEQSNENPQFTESAMGDTPLVNEGSEEGLISEPQMAKLHAALSPMSHDNIRKFCGSVLQIELDSMKHLTWTQAAKCIDAAERRNR